MDFVRLGFRAILGRRLPITSGVLRVQGLEEAITIRRDQFGVPYVTAQTDSDAWYGLGFCQGQDRAFQTEMLLHVCRGTLSQLIGPDALQIDRLSRRIGFYHYAKQQVDLLDPDIYACLDAFARGINEGNTVGCHKPAHEFTLLGTKPTPLDVVDVLAGYKYVAFALSVWSEKLTRLIVLREDGPEAVCALSGSYAPWLRVSCPVGAAAGPTLNRLAQDLAQLAGVLGWRGGSNNWALNASRTATGRPILANDPHLGKTIPPPWYLAHLRTPEWTIAGAAYACSPTFAAGHNGLAAWGVTAGLADDVDLYLEEIGEDGRSVREGNRFVPCEVRQETIQVKGAPPVVEEVLVTQRGPIISPALDGDLEAISMHATWMDPRPIRGIHAFHRVQSFGQFRHALSQPIGASLNMVYADTSDTIGWQLVGNVPQRQGTWSTVPLPGWDAAVDERPGLVPFEQMPHVSNPAAGFVATANNRPTPDGEGPYVGTFWTDGYRHARIVELLEQRDNWNLDDTRRMQMDQTAIPWREMRTAVLAVPAEQAETRTALDLLRSWDGIVTADAPAAAVYEFFVSEMLARIVRAKAPSSFEWAMHKGFNPLILFSSVSEYRLTLVVKLLNEQPDGWLGRAWADEIADALSTAVHKLQDRFGASPDRWAWGRVRPLTLVHAFGSRRPLDRIFNVGPFPWGGDSSTVAHTGCDSVDPTLNSGALANLRMVLDVGNWEDNCFVLAGGQSGNPLSPHYTDLLALWKRGDGIAIAWSEARIAQITTSTLQLEPAL
jgi:penicillin amidase